MISYCVCCLRPKYASLLIEELIRKTTAPYEILVWINTPDRSIPELVARRAAEGRPIRIVGDTPHNIGMAAFKELFKAARHDMIVQMDDDVVCVSRGIAEKAAAVFKRHPEVRQLVADVCQDEWTTGARPPMAHYRPYAPADGLFEGPVDGWFSVYRRAIMHVLMEAPYERYFCLGAFVSARLRHYGIRGLLCTRLKVFHVTGPGYATMFGTFHDEIEKYRAVGRRDMVDWYSRSSFSPEDLRAMTARYEDIKKELGTDPLAIAGVGGQGA